MNISVMIDIVIAGALVLFTALGWKRGLIRTLAELAAVVLALSLSARLASAAAPKIVDQYLRPAAHGAIENRIALLAAGPEDQVISHETLEGVMDGIPFVGTHAKELLADKAFSAQDRLFDEALSLLLHTALDTADTVLDGAVRDMVQSLLCSALFLLLTTVLRMAAKVLRVAEKLPGIRQLNGLGGALVGLGKGLILVCLCVWVLRRTGTITPEMAENSIALGVLPGWLSAAGK